MCVGAWTFLLGLKADERGEMEDDGSDFSSSSSSSRIIMLSIAKEGVYWRDIKTWLNTGQWSPIIAQEHNILQVILR